MPKFLGFQLANAKGENIQGLDDDPTNMPSFEIMAPALAARIIGQLPSGFLLAPIYEGMIENATIIGAADPLKITVHVCNIDHRHGTSHLLDTTKEGIVGKLAKWCRQYASGEGVNLTDDMDDHAVIEAYFEKVETEGYSIGEESLDLPEIAAPARKITVHVVNTCIPDQSEPTIPSVFATLSGAEAFADKMLRAEWETNGPEDDDGNRLPYPGSWDEANRQIAAEHADSETKWGEWEITSHEVETAAPLDPLSVRLLAALEAVLPYAQSHQDDIVSGVYDGTYEEEENRDDMQTMDRVIPAAEKLIAEAKAAPAPAPGSHAALLMLFNELCTKADALINEVGNLRPSEPMVRAGELADELEDFIVNHCGHDDTAPDDGSLAALVAGYGQLHDTLSDFLETPGNPVAKHAPDMQKKVADMLESLGSNTAQVGVTVSFLDSERDEVTDPIGPFTFAQITYHTLRVGHDTPDGESVIAMMHGDADSWLYGDRKFSDIIFNAALIPAKT